MLITRIMMRFLSSESQPQEISLIYACRCHHHFLLIYKSRFFFVLSTCFLLCDWLNRAHRNIRHVVSSAVHCLLSLYTIWVNPKAVCKDVLIGTTALQENSLLFCPTAHVTQVEGGSALPALWWVIESLSVQPGLHCLFLAIITQSPLSGLV